MVVARLVEPDGAGSIHSDIVSRENTSNRDLTRYAPLRVGFGVDRKGFRRSDNLTACRFLVKK
jgi:hypothetical protein